MLVRERIDHALKAAVQFLLGRQAPDGAWRSARYAFFKDGDALTPLVLHALGATQSLDNLLPNLRKGAAYLAALVRSDGTIDEGPHGLSYPAYTAALTVVVLSQSFCAEHRNARDAWLAYLRERQLTEALDWRPEDRAYGGWGYAHDLPRKPQVGRPADLLTESNLSATVFAIEALCAADCPAHDPVFDQALTFVRRCQNYADDPEPAFDDGGFYFMDNDPLRNKAGVAGTDRTGRPRYASYGSATADGLRALLACGVPRTDARLTAARRWLEDRFSTSVHPGQFASGRALLQVSIYYYYCWSLVGALAACGPEALTAVRAAALAEELLRRQQADGSWLNHAVEVREDDPLVATPFAVETLTACRRAVSAV